MTSLWLVLGCAFLGAPGSEGATSGTAPHWAYQAPLRPPLPAVSDPSWPRNAIDCFVLARLDHEGLHPSPETDRVRLIRRVSLDLIGLPPTPAEVDAFLADGRPDAFASVVDRLLGSPRYGERWARVWLDLARYADTNGYEKDNRRSIWPYRDWVIDAFNRNLPFDRFTIEQLAGDLLPHPTRPQRIATGFHRNTMTNTEGGTDNEEFRVAAVVDRVNTTMEVWMGTTFGCAQCHDHKYDPFTQREYYQIFAYFNGSADNDNDDNTPVIEVPLPELVARRAEINTEIAALEKVLDTPTPALAAAQREWEQHRAALAASWKTLEPVGLLSARGAGLARLPDGSVRVNGNRPQSDTYTVVVNTDLQGITGFRLEALRDDSLPNKGPGRASDGAFVLSAIRVSAATADGTGKPSPVELSQATADYEEDGWPAGNLIDDDAKKGWGVRRETGRTRTLALELSEPVGRTGGTTLTFTLEQRHGKQHTLGHFRLSATTVSAPVRVHPMSQEIAEELTVAADQRTETQRRIVAAYYRSIAPGLQPTRDRIADRKRALPKLPTTLVMKELAKPRETHVLLRGNFLSKGERVSAAVPAAWSAVDKVPARQPPNRLTLARWLVSPGNPLVGRVMMNRLWEQHFGIGLVQTSEDFGTQGTPPSHPALLDWLATELVRHHWDIKAMHRLIVTSATYRQSSLVTPEQHERDPHNRLLSRGPRFRLPAEIIRDRILAASGLLSMKMHGPSVMPPQPDGVWQVIYSNDRWVTSPGEDRYRRAVYTFWRRTSPHPAMTTFDAPSREVCVLRRPRTNTPLQALLLLNDPACIEAARALARRMLTEAGPDASDRAAYGFRLCLSRAPEPAERDRLVALVAAESKHFSQDARAAATMAGIDPAKPSGELDPAELAAWTVAANVLLNLDEVVTQQ